jgi:hypothetical protein
MTYKLILLLFIVFSTFILVIWFLISLLRAGNLKSSRFFALVVGENQGVERVLAISAMVWTGFFTVALGMVLFLATMCCFYFIALVHGEFVLLLDAVPITAGSVAIHLIYPLEIYVLGLFCIVLFIGSAQIFTGPIEPLARLALRMNGIGDMCRKLVMLLLVVLLLELTKTATYSLQQPPEALASFFAGDRMPLTRPLPLAGLIAGCFALSGWFVRAMSKGSGR